MSLPILTEAGSLLARYEVLISDVWGVVHDGLWALDPACAALTRYREAGGAVVLLSNAPGPSAQVAEVIDKKRVPRGCWNRLVTSGDVTRALIAASHHQKAYHIGWKSDLAVFEGLGMRGRRRGRGRDRRRYRAERLPHRAAGAVPAAAAALCGARPALHLRQSRSRRACRA